MKQNQFRRNLFAKLIIPDLKDNKEDKLFKSTTRFEGIT